MADTGSVLAYMTYNRCNLGVLALSGKTSIMMEARIMRTRSKKLAAYLMAGLLSMTTMTLPLSAHAAGYGYSNQEKEVTGGTMMADAFLFRPFMLASTVVTTATFIITLPFSALGGNVGESADKLVVQPAAYTFVRPLGDL